MSGTSKMEKSEHDIEAPGARPDDVFTEGYSKETTHDPVFGEVTEDGPNYRSLGWVGTSVLMMKSQIGLGVLSIPSTFDALGMIPGVICLVAIGVMTTWSDYMVGVFKLKHREVYSLDDAGQLMFGRIGREFLAVAFVLYYIFVAGSGMVGISIGLNSMSTHGACTAVFVVVAAISGYMLASIRTLGKITWLAWSGLFFILAAIFTVTIAVGVQDRPAAAPQGVPWKSNFKMTNEPTFAQGISAISAMVFAFSGTPGFFSIAAEMRDPRYFTRSMLICQVVVTVTYVVIGVVVYYYCGSFVASPALGSAGPLLKKICYGLALPGLLVTECIVLHIPGKYLFVRIMRGSKHLTANTPTHWTVWLGCTFVVTLVAYIIASGIPIFGGLVSLIGALLGTFMCLQPMGCMWLYDNWHLGKDKANRTLLWSFMVGWSVFIVVSGTFLTVAGTYGSVVGIIDSYKKTGGTGAWSCADNSNSV